MNLDDVFYEILLDYMAPEYADQLSALLACKAKEHSHHQLVIGFLIGIIVTLLFTFLG